MAEAFAVAASAIGIAGVALQLADGVAKLKDFRDRVMNAPTELHDLLDEIEDYVGLLEDLEKDVQQQSLQGSSSKLAQLQKSLKHCSTAAKSIKRVADEFEQAMQRKKRLTSVKMVLKSDEIERSMRKLDRSRDNLQFAYKLYMDASMQQVIVSGYNDLRMLIMQQQLQVSTLSPPCIDSTTSSADDKHRQGVIKIRKIPPKILKRPRPYFVRIPGWAWPQLLDLSFSYPMAGWDFSLRSYRVHKSGSWAYTMCYSSSVTDFQALLKSREISIYDRFESGDSLLTAAIFYGNCELATFLHDEGLYACLDAEPHWDDFCVNDSIYLHFSQWHTPLKQFVESRADGVEGVLVSYVTDPVMRWTDYERVSFFVDHVSCAAPTWLSEIFGSLQIDARLFQIRADCGATLLHPIARWWAWALAAVALPRFGEVTEAGLPHLGQVLENAARGGAVLHPVSNSTRRYHTTPLTTLINQIIRMCEPDLKMCQKALTTWISALHRADVDLEQYGRIESAYIGESLHDEQRRKDRLEHGDFSTIWYLTYGPAVEDWQFWEGHLGDVYAGIFWDMIEHPERAIPGAWRDNDLEDGFFDDEGFTRKGVISQMRKYNWLCRTNNFEALLSEEHWDMDEYIYAIGERRALASAQGIARIEELQEDEKSIADEDPMLPQVSSETWDWNIVLGPQPRIEPTWRQPY